eukprot:jgi/Chlat1/8141/Chrsp75S07567
MALVRGGGGMVVEAAQIPTDLGRTMRACLRCALLKTYDQFAEGGCENCPFFKMETDRDRVLECTTPNFTGMIAVTEPDGSWAAKWLHLGRFVAGCYALSTTGELPEEMQNILEDQGIRYVPKT